MYEYRAHVLSVYDGDTLRVDIDCGFGVWLFNQPLRLAGLNAPEMGTPEGRAARDWLRQLLPIGADVIVHTSKDAKEKYGRYLAEVYPADAESDLSLNQAMINAGHAKPWDGTGPRPV